MVLRLPSLVLRPWAAGDIEALAAVANDRRIWINLKDRFPHPYTRADAEAWIALCERQGEGATNLTIEVEGRVAGGIGLERLDDVHRGTAEIGYWLGTSYWGRGLATAAVVALTQYAFAHLGLERVQAGVFEWNPASCRVLQKAGYELEGRLRRHVVKDGRVGDVLLHARTRVAAPPPCAEPPAKPCPESAAARAL